MSETRALLVLVTTATEKEAVAIAQALVEREEAACVNIVAMVRSIYRWKDKVWNETEQLMVIKTTPQALEDVKRTVKELHSYELPDIIALPITDGDAKAIAWIGASVKASRDSA